MITFEEVLPLLESESDEDNRLAVILIAQYDLMESMESTHLQLSSDRVYRVERRAEEFKFQLILARKKGYLLYVNTIRRLTDHSYIIAMANNFKHVTYSDGTIQIPEQYDDNNK